MIYEILIFSTYLIFNDWYINTYLNIDEKNVH